MSAAVAYRDELQRLEAKIDRGFETLQTIRRPKRGVTARDAVYSEDKITLYRYRSRTKKQIGPPMLISYALVNRPYMMDLQEDRSVLRGLLDLGVDVYLIDWGYPDANDSHITLADYIQGYLGNCVDFIRADRGVEKINLLGVCQGGAFSLTYTALNQDKIKNLITMITPVDFHTPENLLSRWAREMDVDEVVDAFGNFPGELLNWTYMAIRPFRQSAQKYIGLVDALERPKYLENFLRMEQWVFDTPDQAGTAFRQFSQWYFQENRLVEGKVELNGERVDLANIDVPVLNIYAQDDHLIPPSASKVLPGYISSTDYTEVAFKGGHIGIYVSSSAQQRIPPTIADWLAERC